MPAHAADLRRVVAGEAVEAHRLKHLHVVAETLEQGPAPVAAHESIPDDLDAPGRLHTG